MSQVEMLAGGEEKKPYNSFSLLSCPSGNPCSYNRANGKLLMGSQWLFRIETIFMTLSEATSELYIMLTHLGLSMLHCFST
jgi:hypothetical protein